VSLVPLFRDALRLGCCCRCGAATFWFCSQRWCAACHAEMSEDFSDHAGEPE